MQPRHLFAVITIITVLTLQFIVPSVQFFEDGANRWGWQMYSRETVRPEVTAVHADGSRSEVRLGDHVYRQRAGLRIDQDVLRQLCERNPDVDHFELASPETGEVSVYPCHE